MNLSKSVERFALETITDPYGVGGSIKGHISIFDDGKNSNRRILETLPTCTMYSSNCVSHPKGIFIVGAPYYDYHKGNLVRVRYVAIPCEDQFKIASVYQIITSTVTSRVTYVSINQTKSFTTAAETSYIINGYRALMPDLESVSKGSVLITGSNYYRVKSDPWIDEVGFKNVDVILLTSPVRTVTFVQVAGFDPLTETMTAGTSFLNTKVFMEDAYYSYEHNTERFAQLKPGDKNITFKPSVVPKSGDTIDVYKILSVDTLSDGTYSCHCRRG